MAPMTHGLVPAIQTYAGPGGRRLPGASCQLREYREKPFPKRDKMSIRTYSASHITLCSAAWSEVSWYRQSDIVKHAQRTER